MKTLRIMAIIVAAGLVWMITDTFSTPKKPENAAAPPKNEKSDIEIGLAEPAAWSQIETRLRRSITAKGGLFIVVPEPGISTYVLPVSTSWVVQCGVGLSVVFGSSITGDGDNPAVATNDVQVWLSTSVTLDKAVCGSIAPQVGAWIIGATQK